MTGPTTAPAVLTLPLLLVVKYHLPERVGGVSPLFAIDMRIISFDCFIEWRLFPGREGIGQLLPVMFTLSHFLLAKQAGIQLTA